MFSNKKNLANVLSILVNCSCDNSFLLLYDEERQDYWLPSVKMNERDSWKSNLETFKKKLFDYEITDNKLLKIYKMWTLEKEYFHLIFLVNVTKEVKKHCETYSQLVRNRQGKIEWYTCAQIVKLKPFLRSLEVIEAMQQISTKKNEHEEKEDGEPVSMGSLVEIRREDILLNSDNCENQAKLGLLESAGFPTEEQNDLYEHFFLHTYPCMYMNSVSFKKSLSRIEVTWNLDDLFKSADVWKRGFLTFQDYLFFIAVMEPYTGHYGSLAEIRCQYIFRYYDQNRDGKLEYNDVQRLVSDALQIKNSETSATEKKKQIFAALKVINFNENSIMSPEVFCSYVLDAKILDTSFLLRFDQSQCDMSPIAILKDSCKRELVPNQIVLQTNAVDKFSPCTGYDIVLNTTLLKPGDNPLQIKDLRFLEETMTKSVAEDFKVLSNIKLNQVDPSDLENRICELLLALRYFCTEICHSPLCCGELEFEEKDSYSWGSAYLEKLGITLIMMCEQMKQILCEEPRLIEIDPPVYIMGDLHGNYHDLVCFEKTLWPNGMSLVPSKLLFLGDYVDRGLNSLEVVMYLFANKIQAPRKLYLIRGNHEVREIQKLFTFQRECVFKLGRMLGMSVWKAINEVFDTMPLAAVIDHKVFCCHGGIPPPWLCPTISIINTIPCPLANCERQSPLAWALMWNDPLKGVNRDSIQEIELFTNDGFLPNLQRGTGYVFSSDALNQFLKTNNLSHVVRAHEVVKAGFQIQQKAKLLTVFSSSGYCGGKNYAASILVADQLLRVFMVDTGIN